MRRIVVMALALTLVAGLLGGVCGAGGAPVARVLVGFKGSPDPAVVEAAGGEVEYVYRIVPAVCAVMPTRALEGLRQHAAVDYVEFDGTCYALAEFIPWGVQAVGAPEVWAEGIWGDNAKVAVVDTGVDMDHPDLIVMGGYDYYNNDSNPDDDHGHGTLVAGIIAARYNTVGMVGVAPMAHLYAVKVLNASGSGSWSTVARGIEWCVANGMDVINLSLGGTSGSTTVRTACENAWNAGLVLSVAAGDSGNREGTGDNVTYPARYTPCIAVAAVDSNLVRASWSSTGPKVELSAPGVGIYSCYPGGYTTMSGTSMSCPHVAGVACLVKSAHPQNTNQQIRDAMDFTAIDLGAPGRDNLYGYGLVWAPGAVDYPGAGR